MPSKSPDDANDDPTGIATPWAYWADDFEVTDPLADESVADASPPRITPALLASFLNVSGIQAERWLSGEEIPSQGTMEFLLDLKDVLKRASLIWQGDVAIDWLAGSNSYLSGARPVDVLKLRGPTEVLEALDAAMAGAFS